MRDLNKRLLLALLIPLLALAALVVYKKVIIANGQEVTLPIRGYDPRDILHGHYLTYRIDYGVKDICHKNTYRAQAYICLSSKSFRITKPNNCHLFIKGKCTSRGFIAGVERYYVPESQAKRLEGIVRAGKASIVLSVLSNGIAHIKKLELTPNQ